MLQYGDSQIQNLWYGKDHIREIYKGSQLLWKMGEFTPVFEGVFNVKGYPNQALRPSIPSPSTVSVKTVNTQKSFDIPSGNYSGITYLGDNVYAIVDGKGTYNWRLVEIILDSSGQISSVTDKGTVGTSSVSDIEQGVDIPDKEGIVYAKAAGLNSIWITSKSNNLIFEYDVETGAPTGNSFSTKQFFGSIISNYGHTALAWSNTYKCFFTTTEVPQDVTPASYSNKVVNQNIIARYDRYGRPCGRWLYNMDLPQGADDSYSSYVFGIPEMVCLEDGSLIILEREAGVYSEYYNSYVYIKLYQVNPLRQQGILTKKLLTSFSTILKVTDLAWANFEGMCLGPRLANGNLPLILVSDSQNNAGGILKDFFKTIILSGI